MTNFAKWPSVTNFDQPRVTFFNAEITRTRQRVTGNVRHWLIVCAPSIALLTWGPCSRLQGVAEAMHNTYNDGVFLDYISLLVGWPATWELRFNTSMSKSILLIKVLNFLNKPLSEDLPTDYITHNTFQDSQHPISLIRIIIPCQAYQYDWNIEPFKSVHSTDSLPTQVVTCHF